MQLQEWEFLQEQGHIHSTGIFNSDHFTNSLAANEALEVLMHDHEMHPDPAPVVQEQVQAEINPADDEPVLREIMEELIVPQVRVSGNDVVFQIVFDGMTKEDESFDVPEMSQGPTVEELAAPQIDGGFGIAKFDELFMMEYQEPEVDDDNENDKNVVEIEGNGGQKRLISHWQSTGARALCSIAVAIATFFILRSQPQGQQKRHIQANGDHKMTNQVEREASIRVKSVGAANRGSPTTKPNISSGGHFDWLLL